MPFSVCLYRTFLLSLASIFHVGNEKLSKRRRRGEVIGGQTKNRRGNVQQLPWSDITNSSGCQEWDKTDKQQMSAHSTVCTVFPEYGH